MLCCINPSCQQPQNPDGTKFCQSCGARLDPLLRNRYRVLRPIGQGGFGKTYLAVDQDMLQTSCVIKQFSPQSQGTKSLEKAIALFNQEAVRLHQLGEHPQIPTLLAYFEHDKRLYLVQQFIEGQNLFQEVHRGAGIFNEEKIRQLLLDLLPVLKFIHSRQVIHRDITPANIIRRQIDGKLVLIDFGIAKQLTENSESQPGTRIGTEGYAPLEQLRSGQVYPASDIYSLGSTCIYLMTLTKPDLLYNPLDGRWIWQEHLAKKGIAVSDSLAKILNKMLQDLVSYRYQSADQVLQDLHNICLPPTSSPPGVARKPPTSTPPNFAQQSPASRPPTYTNNPSNPPFSQPPLSRRAVSQFAAVKPPAFKTGNTGWKCVNTIAAHSSWITSVAISANKHIIASGSLEDQIKIWNLQTGELLHTLTGHAKGVNGLAITPDSNILVSCGDDANVKIWNLASGNTIYTLSEHNQKVNSIAISNDGQIIVSGSVDRTVKIWNLKNGSNLRNLPGIGGMIKAVAISPNRQILATGGMDNQIKIWNIAKGEVIRSIQGHFNSVHAVAFTPDGKILVSASKDKTIKLWNLENGQNIRTLSGHSAAVNSIVITPDNQKIISASSDNTIKVWRLDNGELTETLTEHTNPVNSISISPDGLILVSGSWDKTVRIWYG